MSDKSPELPEINYTPRTHAVLFLARQIALEKGHSYVGTEHVLMAICRHPGGVANSALYKMGLTEEKAWNLMERERLGECQSFISAVSEIVKVKSVDTSVIPTDANMGLKEFHKIASAIPGIIKQLADIQTALWKNRHTLPPTYDPD